MSERALRPAVFLDRDGTINVEVDYLADPAAFELLPGVGEALRRLRDAGFALVVVTNQSGVARGRLSERRLAEIHARMHALLEAEGARVDRVEYCPHHPAIGPARYRVDCDCRKPRPGMLVAAAKALDLDLDASWIVGDSLRDLEAGEAVGARGILVRTGKGAKIEAGLEPERAARTVVVDDLLAAAEYVLGAPAAR